jgi:prepilin-type N-terminal cleavage/methylation domain-containing protein
VNTATTQTGTGDGGCARTCVKEGQRSEAEWGGLRTSAPAPRGFTLVELLTVISIIGMLMSLTLPAIMQAREAGRRTQCANNLRNVALAMQGFATTRGRLPAAGNFSTSGKEFHSWVVSVLPYVERTDIARAWDYTAPVGNAPNAALATLTVEVLICPDDNSLAPGMGNLSYVVNGGFGWTEPVDCPAIMQSGAGGPQAIDLNGNGVTCPTIASQDGTPNDRELYYQTGVFFPENWPLGSGTVRHHSLETISDGLSRTIMLAENTWARVAGGEAGWASPRNRSRHFSRFVPRTGART